MAGGPVAQSVVGGPACDGVVVPRVWAQVPSHLSLFPRRQEQFQRNPDSYNGAVRENYTWSQDYTDLELKVPVPKHVVKGRQVTTGLPRLGSPHAGLGVGCAGAAGPVSASPCSHGRTPPACCAARAHLVGAGSVPCHPVVRGRVSAQDTAGEAGRPEASSISRSGARGRPGSELPRGAGSWPVGWGRSQLQSLSPSPGA